jgi:spermidine/putrescine transport system substrate-binding protein
MIKKMVSLIAAAGIASFFAGCGSQKQTLHVYSWADYISPEEVVNFENEFNCRVVIDTFDSNESMYAKLKAGATGYDLLVPSSYMIKTMASQGMLEKIDKALIPNLEYIDPDHLEIAMDPQMQYSVPYMTGGTGLGYLGRRVSDFAPSWAMFDREDLKGRTTLLNDMRETIGGALKYLGYSLNTTSEQELAEARDIVIRWKKNIAKFENEQYKSGLASEEFVLVHGYSGDIAQIMEDNEDIQFAVPAEGTSIFCDDFAIPKGAKNLKLAHEFINYFHRPEVAAKNIEFVYYLCPNKGAYEFLSDDIRQDPCVFIDPEVKEKSEVIGDVGEALVIYTRMWDEIKAAE